MGLFKSIGFLVICIVMFAFSTVTVKGASYIPAVQAGQWGKFAPLYDVCQPSFSPACQGQSSGGFNDTTYGLIKIMAVSETTVVFQLFIQYKNGTSSSIEGQVDVASGTSNVTSFNGGTTPSDYFVLAGGLQANDPIWNSAGAPKLNSTTTEQFLGSSRTIDFLNYSSSYTSQAYSYSSSFGFAFDQASGMFVGFSFSSSQNSQYGGSSQMSFALGMIDNNIWRPSTLPDFTVSPVQSMTFQTGSSGAATITVTSQTGFTSEVQLSLRAPTGLTCSLDHNKIQGSGSSTLTCSGQPGTYAVTITATGGSNTHSQTENVTVNSAPAAPRPSTGFPMIYLYGAVAAVVVVVAIASVLLFMRKKSTTPASPAVVNPQTPASPS